MMKEIFGLKPGSSSWLATSIEATRALEEYGCFIAEYDNIFLDLNDVVLQALQDLFRLPIETKVQNKSTKPLYGYVGQIPFIPLYESLGFDYSNTLDGIQSFTDIMWPNGNEAFGGSALMFAKAVAELDQTVMKMVAKSYGIEEHYKTLIGSTTYLLRLLKYLSPKDNERNLGLRPHTDKSFMSILHQQQVKGLEIKTKDGKWIEVDPSPSSFIVMAGDACMAWTNGRIEASCHRVTMQGKKERFSLGLFTFIRDLEIQIPKELVDEDHPLQFKAFDNYKYMHYYHTDEGKRSKCPIKSYCGI